MVCSQLRLVVIRVPLQMQDTRPIWMYTQSLSALTIKVIAIQSEVDYSCAHTHTISNIS